MFNRNNIRQYKQNIGCNSDKSIYDKAFKHGIKIGYNLALQEACNDNNTEVMKKINDLKKNI